MLLKLHNQYQIIKRYLIILLRTIRYLLLFLHWYAYKFTGQILSLLGYEWRISTSAVSPLLYQSQSFVAIVVSCIASCLHSYRTLTSILALWYSKINMTIKVTHFVNSFLENVNNYKILAQILCFSHVFEVICYF